MYTNWFDIVKMGLANIVRRMERGRDRIVVSTLRCGRNNPGSNPGHGSPKQVVDSLRSFSFSFTSLFPPGSSQTNGGIRRNVAIAHTLQNAAEARRLHDDKWIKLSLPS